MQTTSITKTHILLLSMTLFIPLFGMTPSAQQSAVQETTISRAQKTATDILIQGMAGGIAQTLSAFMVDTLRATGRCAYAYWTFVSSIGKKGFNRACRRPEPLDAEQLRLFLHLVDEYLNALTEQPLSEALVLKSMRVQPDELDTTEVNQQWVFMVEQVEELFGYIIAWLNTHATYYQVTQEQRTWLSQLYWRCSSTRRESIIFISHMLVKQLNHVVQLSKAASSVDDLDVVHLKKIGRATVLYFKKLIVLVGGNTQDMPLSQPYTGVAGVSAGMESAPIY